MKTTLKIFLFLVVAFGFSATAKAQTATGSASVTVLTPISIAAGTALNFGSIVPHLTETGTATVSTAGVRTLSTYIKAINTTGVAAATFNVTGIASQAYTITLPSTDVELAKGLDKMIVNGFTSNPTSGALSSGGAQTISVGAVLNVSADQAPGSYSGTYSVTVAYQ